MVNRTICEVLEAMRKAYETRNFSYLLGLIEEAQNMASSMESKLFTIKDFGYLKIEIKRLKARKKKILEDIEKAGGDDEE